MAFIAGSIKGGSYFAIFLLSIFISYVIPLPEVVLLLLIGHILRTTGINPQITILACTAGIILGDNILYRLSFFGNKYVERFKHKMRKHALIRYENLVEDNIGKTIYFLRFVTGVRFFGPVISGTLGISWKKFFFYNAIATIIHSMFFLLLGYYYRGGIVILITEVEIVRNILLFSSAVIVGGLIGIFSKQNKISNK